MSKVRGGSVKEVLDWRGRHWWADKRLRYRPGDSDSYPEDGWISVGDDGGEYLAVWVPPFDDKMIINKTDGVYVLTGDDESNWRIDKLTGSEAYLASLTGRP